MTFDPLPTPASLRDALRVAEQQLAALDIRLAAARYPVQSSDQRLQVVANGIPLLVSLSIDPMRADRDRLTELGAELARLVGQALAAADAQSAIEAASFAQTLALGGLFPASGALPNIAGFAAAVAMMQALRPQVQAFLETPEFQGQAGVAIAVVNGRHDVIRITLRGLPDDIHLLEGDVVAAVNAALKRARGRLDEGAGQAVGGLPPAVVSFADLALYARGSLQIADRVQLKRPDGTFAALANAGNGEISIGVEAQVGDVWSLGPVVLRDRCRVHGSVRTARTVTRQNATQVSGQVREGVPLLLPVLSPAATFPATNQGAVHIEPGQRRMLPPGAYTTAVIKANAEVSLSSGSYFFESLSVEPNSKLIVDADDAPAILYLKQAFLFRGAMISRSGGRPKIVIECFGPALVSVEAPFTGTLVAPNALINLASVGTPGHSGAFFGKDVIVQPGTIIVAIPFVGPPSI
jgi:DNA-binding protein YbaB